jgi:hypothetical protein
MLARVLRAGTGILRAIRGGLAQASIGAVLRLSGACLTVLCVATPVNAQTKSCDVSCDASCSQCCDSWTLVAMCGPTTHRISGDYQNHATATRVAKWLNDTAAACKAGASCTQRVACPESSTARWDLLCAASGNGAGRTADGARLLAAQRHARAQFVAISDVLPWVAALAQYSGSDFRAKQLKRKANDSAKKLISARGSVRTTDDRIKRALASNASGAAIHKPLSEADEALASGAKAIADGRKLAASARRIGVKPVDTRPNRQSPKTTAGTGVEFSRTRVQSTLVATSKAVNQAQLRAMKFSQRPDATAWGKQAAKRHQASLQEVKKELSGVYNALRTATTEAQLQKLERQVGELSGRAKTEHAQLIRTINSPQATRK